MPYPLNKKTVPPVYVFDKWQALYQDEVAQVTSLTSQLAQTQAALTQAQADLAVAQAQVASLQSQVTSLQSQVTSLQQQVTELSDQAFPRFVKTQIAINRDVSPLIGPETYQQINRTGGGYP